MFSQGRVLQGPDDSRPGERTRVRCGQPGGSRALCCGLDRLLLKLLVVNRELSARPSSWVIAHPRPSPISTRRCGRGQGGLEFVIPGRVCERNAGPGIGVERSGSRRKGTRLGFSGTRPKKKSSRGSASHNPVGRKVFCYRGPWVGFALKDLASG